MRLNYLPYLVSLGVAVLLLGCRTQQSQAPAFRYDLKSHGLKVDGREEGMASYNQLAFLGDDLLLIAINQTTNNRRVERADVELPPATFLIFDTSQRKLIRTSERPLEKYAYSVQPLKNERFAIRDQSGVKVCSTDLTCGLPKPLPGGGPLLASPSGDVFIGGGFGHTQQILFDGVSLRELNRFDPADQSMIPGNERALFHVEDGVPHITEAGKSIRTLPIHAITGSYIPYSRFLSNSEVGISESTTTLLVSRLDGTMLYRVPVNAWYRATSLISSTGGRRFGIREIDYSRFNSIIHFMDIDNHRPFDRERIRLLETASGRLVFEIQDDPRPYLNQLTLPALSPDGHRLAVIRSGFLEVYDIP